MPDPQYELGALTQAVKTLTEEVSKLRDKVGDIERKLNRGTGFGKGFVSGLTLFAGMVGAAGYYLIAKVVGVR